MRAGPSLRLSPRSFLVGRERIQWPVAGQGRGEGGASHLPAAIAKSLATLWVVLAAALASSSAAAPNVVRVSPSALVPGKETVITLLGDNLQGAADLWTSFGAEAVPIVSSNSTAFRLALPKQSRAGFGAVRLVTANGLSGFHFLLIDPLPAVTASGTNRSFASAQPLIRSVAVDGACEELHSDFYRIALKKGERLSLEVAARRRRN